MVILCRQSLAAGFSREDNELFYDKTTMMVFSDTKSTLTSLVQLMKEQESDVRNAA